MQLVYCSQPFGYSLEILSAILIASRANNRKHDITGALICRSDIFLQLLEGPEQKVKNTYETIQKDDRHINVYHPSISFVKSVYFLHGQWKTTPLKHGCGAGRRFQTELLKACLKLRSKKFLLNFLKKRQFLIFRQCLNMWVTLPISLPLFALF